MRENLPQPAQREEELPASCCATIPPAIRGAYSLGNQRHPHDSTKEKKWWAV